MKLLTKGVAIITLFSTAITSAANEVFLKINDAYLIYNHSGQPYLSSQGHVMVSLNVLAYSVGWSIIYSTHGGLLRAVIHTPVGRIELTEASRSMTLGRVNQQLSAQPLAYRNAKYDLIVPVSNLANYLGLAIQWRPEHKTLEIRIPNAALQVYPTIVPSMGQMYQTRPNPQLRLTSLRIDPNGVANFSILTNDNPRISAEQIIFYTLILSGQGVINGSTNPTIMHSTKAPPPEQFCRNAGSEVRCHFDFEGLAYQPFHAGQGDSDKVTNTPNPVDFIFLELHTIVDKR